MPRRRTPIIRGLNLILALNMMAHVTGCELVAQSGTGSGGNAQSPGEVKALIRGELDGQLVAAGSGVVIGKQHILTAAHVFQVAGENPNAGIHWTIQVGDTTRVIDYVVFPPGTNGTQPVTRTDIAVAVTASGNDFAQSAKIRSAAVSPLPTADTFDCSFSAVGYGAPQAPLASSPEASVCLTDPLTPLYANLPEEKQRALEEYGGGFGSVFDQGMGVFVSNDHPGIPEPQRNPAPSYPSRTLVAGDSGGGVFDTNNELVAIIAGCGVLSPEICQDPQIASYASTAAVWIEPHRQWIDAAVDNCRDGMSLSLCTSLLARPGALALCEAPAYNAHADWSRNPLFANLCLPSCGELSRLAGSSAGRAECHETFPEGRRWDNPFTAELEGDWVDLTAALGQSHDCHHCLLWVGQPSCSDLVNAYASQRGQDSSMYKGREQCLLTPFSAMTQEERAMWEARFTSKAWVNLGHLFGGAQECAECVLEAP